MRAYQIEQTALDDADLTDEFRETNSATYCPEDDKIRLYLSRRVSRDSFLYLKKCGFVATPKQDCSFAAVWSIAAEDVALLLIADDDDIGDEDYSPAERAADRAERFAGYREHRRRDAGALADRYDSGPSAIGYQNAARAERAAARRDRVRDRSLCQWDKAEYWQHRTAGVISHALHKSSAHVRRGRILEIEKTLRKVESWGENYSRTFAHLRMRLLYENAMLANEGGQASEVEMEIGGWLGGKQIHKINRSPVTKRIVSVGLWMPHPWRKNSEGNPVMYLEPFNIERFGANAYRAPTEEERAAFQPKKVTKPKAPPLVNLTPEAAQLLQDHWNREAEAGYVAHCQRRGYTLTPWKNRPILQMTQSAYSERSGGTYSPYETRGITAEGKLLRDGDKGGAFRVRVSFHGTVTSWSGEAYGIIVLTDKPQTALPIELNKHEPAPVVENPALAPIDRHAVPAGQLF